MPYYYVNRNKDEKGLKEVHDRDSANDHDKPNPENRIDLGYHNDCQSAVRSARAMGYNADGCYYCPNTKPCHTG